MNEQFNGHSSGIDDRHAEEVVASLNRLIQACVDAQRGFDAAAESVQDFELRALFHDAAQLRAVMAEDLCSLVRGLHGDAIPEGTVAGNLQQGWTAIKKRLSAKPDLTVLSDCRRGEESTVETYRQVLEGSLPPEPDVLVRRQFSVIVATCERLKSLEKALGQSSV